MLPPCLVEAFVVTFETSYAKKLNVYLLDVDMQEEKDIENRYATVCGQLNMDQESMEEAWSSYQIIRDNYTLEVHCGIVLAS